MSYTENVTSPSNGAAEADEAKDNSKIQTDLKGICKIIGYIDDEFKCIHNNFSGTLYGGPLALCFLGRIFFFEWTVILKWEDIVQVQKSKKGICLLARSPKDSRFEFEQLQNVDRVWSWLVSLHNDSIIGTPRGPTTARNSARKLRRNNSDPLRMSMASLANFGDYTNDNVTGLSTDGATVQAIHRDFTYKSTVSAPMDDDMCDSTRKTVPKESEPTATVTKTELKKQWSAILEDVSTYAEMAVENHELPCDLESFVSMFIDDGAKYAIPDYMKGNGDADINVSKWQTSEDGVSKSRVIEYTHPVNAPMAPPMARAKKEQTYRKFGEHGLALETKTFVSDVPMTDCFYIADILRVNANGSKVTISMQFDIRFVKTTMFKLIIARTTKKEFESFMHDLAAFMSKSLGEQAVIIPQAEKVSEPTAPIPPGNPLMTNIVVYLLIAVLILQTWIIFDMRTMQGEMRRINTDLYGIQGAECIANQSGDDLMRRMNTDLHGIQAKECIANDPEG